MSRKDKAKKKKTAGDYVLTLVLIVAVVVFCYAAFNLYHIYTAVSYTHLTLPTICSV